LSEGKGGFVDYSKYREQLTRIIYDGDGGDDATTAPSGEAVPTSALDEARALMERSKQRQAEAAK
jgi:hypothetical protein